MVGHRARFGTLLVRALVIVVPVIVVSAATSLSVGYFARRGAALLWNLGSRVPAPSLAVASTIEPVPAELEIFASVSDIAEPRQRSLLHKNVIAGRRGAHRIHVGPDLIRRAVPASGRPSASWTNRGDDHPAGMLISNPGALAGTIQVGDIVFEAEGRSLASFEELVAIVGQAYQKRSKIVSGRLWRRGEPWTITVEPGWATGPRE
jgi:S1-C subfamily serine protease